MKDAPPSLTGIRVRYSELMPENGMKAILIDDELTVGKECWDKLRHAAAIGPRELKAVVNEIRVLDFNSEPLAGYRIEMRSG